MYKSYISLVKSIPKYFILFDAILKGIVFLIFFPNCSFLVYRHKIDFLQFVLYTTVLLNLFTTSNNVLGV